MSTKSRRAGAQAAHPDFQRPKSWRRRSWIVAAATLVPVALPGLFVIAAPDHRTPWWFIPLWLGGAFLLAMAVRQFLERKVTAFDPTDPELPHIRRDGDKNCWTGEVPGLGPSNLEPTLREATKAYPRLRLESVAPDGTSAKLSTKAGWATVGTDITIRQVAPSEPHAPAPNPVSDQPRVSYDIVNTVNHGAASDPLQQADDLSRLIHLLREFAPRTPRSD